MPDINDEQKVNLTDSLHKLEEIADWFENQEEVDVEAGLTKIKDAATLIADSKTRLAEIENEFNVIERQINSETDDAGVIDENDNHDDKPINVSEIPF